MIFKQNSIFIVVHPVQTSGQQIILQQHGNLVITQPLVTVKLSSQFYTLVLFTKINLKHKQFPHHFLS